MKKIFVKAGLPFIFIIFTTSFLFSQTSNQLYSPTTDTGSVAEKFDSLVIARINVKFRDNDLLRSTNNKKFTIFLPEFGNPRGRETVIFKTKQDQNPTTKSFAWYGEIQSQPGSFVLLTQVGNAVAGHIRTNDNKLYRITYVGNRIHQVAQINQSLFKTDRFEPPGSLRLNTDQERRTAETCCDTTIEVLVLYTPQAKDAVGGKDGMHSQIEISINITNESFFRSRITKEVTLAHAEEVEFEETGNIITTRQVLENSSDGIMDNIHALRDTYFADVVVMLIENSPLYTGFANIMETVSPAFEKYAFCVIKRDAATSNFIFPHELGHMLGARHDCSADNALTPFPFSHGYATDNFRTIMAGESRSLRVEYWSNPAVNYRTGEPMGNITSVCQANDAQTLMNTFSVVSKFRCKQQCLDLGVSNQLVPDSVIVTDEITGHEPDPKAGRCALWSLCFWLIVLGAVVIVGIIFWIILKKRKQAQ